MVLIEDEQQHGSKYIKSVLVKWIYRFHHTNAEIR